MSAAPLHIINQSEVLSLAFSPVLKHLLILYVVFFISDKGGKKKKRGIISVLVCSSLQDKFFWVLYGGPENN